MSGSLLHGTMLPPLNRCVGTTKISRSLLSLRGHWILATKKVFDEQNAKDHGHSCDRGHLPFVWGTYETWLKDQNGNLLVDAVVNFEDIFEKKCTNLSLRRLMSQLGSYFL